MKLDNPKVTCMCATRGRFLLLRESISLFLLQDYPNKELLIFNNHPIPLNPHPKLKKLGIRVINAGDYTGKNLEAIYADLIMHVSEDTEYLAMWDDDDFYFPDHLSVSIKAAIESGMGGSCSNEGLWWDRRPFIGDFVTYERNNFEASFVIKKSLVIDNCFKDPTILKNKEDKFFTISWLSLKNQLKHLEEITCCFRWYNPYGYRHCSSNFLHNIGEDTGEGELLRPGPISSLRSNLLLKAVTPELQKLAKKLYSYEFEKFDFIDTIKFWKFWEGDKCDFIKLCDDSLKEWTFHEVKELSRFEFINLIKENGDLTPPLNSYLEACTLYNVSDFFRIYMLHNYGGFWIDSDVLVIGDIDERFCKYASKYEFFMSDASPSSPNTDCTSLLGASPRVQANVFKVCYPKILKRLENGLTSERKDNVPWAGINLIWLDHCNNLGKDDLERTSRFSLVVGACDVRYNCGIEEWDNKKEQYGNITSPSVLYHYTMIKGTPDLTEHVLQSVSDKEFLNRPRTLSLDKYVGLSDNTFSNIIHKIGKSDKHTSHCYDTFYGPFLRDRKEKKGNILEIGVAKFGGGSLLSLSRYLPLSTIYGIDIEPFEIKNKPSSIVLLEGDGYDKEFLDSSLEGLEWDVIIDDGSHHGEDQLFVFNYFHKKLRPNGIIFVEDVPEGNVDYIFDNFEGNKKYLFLIDKTRSPDGGLMPNGDDRIIVYFSE